VTIDSLPRNPRLHRSSSRSRGHPPTVTPQWKLIWWRFRKHRVALVSAVVLVVLYLIAPSPISSPRKIQRDQRELPPRTTDQHHLLRSDGDFTFWPGSIRSVWSGTPTPCA